MLRKCDKCIFFIWMHWVITYKKRIAIAMTIRGNQWAAVIKVKMEECCLRWFRNVEKEQKVLQVQ